jgi:hypothetical protein
MVAKSIWKQLESNESFAVPPGTEFVTRPGQSPVYTNEEIEQLDEIWEIESEKARQRDPPQNLTANPRMGVSDLLYDPTAEQLIAEVYDSDFGKWVTSRILRKQDEKNFGKEKISVLLSAALMPYSEADQSTLWAEKDRSNYVVPGKKSIPIATFLGPDETPYKAFVRETTGKKHSNLEGLVFDEEDLELLGVTCGEGANPMVTYQAPYIKKRGEGESRLIVTGKPFEMRQLVDSGLMGSNGREAVKLYLGRLEQTPERSELADEIETICKYVMNPKVKA